MSVLDLSALGPREVAVEIAPGVQRRVREASVSQVLRWRELGNDARRHGDGDLAEFYDAKIVEQFGLFWREP